MFQPLRASLSAARRPGPTRRPSRRLARILPGFLCAALLAACTQFPEVDGLPPAARSEPPALLTTDELAALRAATVAPASAETALDARARALRERAAALRARPLRS